jgi:hypothetical protein
MTRNSISMFNNAEDSNQKAATMAQEPLNSHMKQECAQKEVTQEDIANCNSKYATGLLTLHNILNAL